MKALIAEQGGLKILKTEEKNEKRLTNSKGYCKRKILSPFDKYNFSHVTFVQSSSSELAKSKIIVATTKKIWRGKRTHLTT